MKKNKLVYDSHELFTEVPELLNRPVVKAVWVFLENFLLQFVKHSYTVSDSIAQYYYKKYGIKMGVVKNVPFFKKIEQAASSSIALAYQVAQTHQLSPSFKPGKPNSGCGVIKSLPTFFDHSKNLSVTFAQTV